MSEFNLDRDIAIKNNVDALGKKWVIHYNRGTSMCYVRPDPDRVDAVIPEEFQGLWTKPSIVEPIIKKYLNDSWDKAEAANAKAERKREVAKEAKKNGAKETKVTDEESAAA